MLARVTWLDSEGREGIVGFESGVMALGLATDKETQLALVSGLGVVTDKVELSHWAFIFGPSITIGNIGTFL